MGCGCNRSLGAYLPGNVVDAGNVALIDAVRMDLYQVGYTQLGLDLSASQGVDADLEMAVGDFRGRNGMSPAFILDEAFLGALVAQAKAAGGKSFVESVSASGGGGGGSSNKGGFPMLPLLALAVGGYLLWRR